MSANPLEKTREDYTELIDRLTSADSPVGIDAQYTHAIIIEFLQNISRRLEKIEATLESGQ